MLRNHRNSRLATFMIVAISGEVLAQTDPQPMFAPVYAVAGIESAQSIAPNTTGLRFSNLRFAPIADNDVLGSIPERASSRFAIGGAVRPDDVDSNNETLGTEDPDPMDALKEKIRKQGWRTPALAKNPKNMICSEPLPTAPLG